MAAVQTFGVDQTFVEAMAPWIKIATTALVNPTSVLVIINQAAATVNNLLTAGFGSGAPVAITALGASDTSYLAAQGAIWCIVHPRLVEATNGTVEAAEDLDTVKEERDACLKRMRDDPYGFFGYEVADYSPGVETSTSSLALDLSTTSQRSRREWDGRSNELGKDEGGFVF